MGAVGVAARVACELEVHTGDGIGSGVYRWRSKIGIAMSGVSVMKPASVPAVDTMIAVAPCHLAFPSDTRR